LKDVKAKPIERWGRKAADPDLLESRVASLFLLRQRGFINFKDTY
jgi:hypothetical protein